MNPEQIASSGTERAEQMALFAWAALSVGTFPELRLMFAIKNAEKGGAIRGSMAKAEGVKAGVSDIMLPVPRHCVHGLFIELKTKTKGKASKEQLEFGDEMFKNGYGFCICKGWEEAKNVLVQYLS